MSMRLGTSTTMAFNRPFGRKNTIEDAVRICAENGYQVLDMSFHDCANFPTPLMGTDYEFDAWIGRIGDAASLYGVEFSQSHLHFYDTITANQEVRDYKDKLIERCLVGSSRLGVKWAVTHAASAWGSERFVEASLKGNLDYLQPLAEYANQMNVGIAIENLWDLNIAPKRRFTTTVEELVSLVDAIDADNVGICWDFEHASIMGQNQTMALRIVGDRLKATHVSDHFGPRGDHLLPYIGETDWSFLSVLSEIGYGGDFMYETHRYTQNVPDVLLGPALKFSIDVGNYLIQIARKQDIGDMK